MSGQSAGMQIPNQNMFAPQPQSFNQQYGQQQNMGGDIYPRYGQFQNQQPMQQQVQPMQQPNNGLLQTFGGGQLGYRQPMQQQMQQPVQQPAPSLLNQQIPSVQQAPMQQPVNALLPAMSTPPLRPNTPQPTFTPSPDMPFGGVGGRPFASQQTPEDYQQMQDYYAQDARDQAEMVRRMQEQVGGAQPLLPIRSAPVAQSLPTTTARAKPAPRIAPRPSPRPAPKKARVRAK
jgi:hypothetical protein